MSNLSILDRNILHSFESVGHAELAEDAYLRFRDKDSERVAEAKVYVLLRVWGVLRGTWKLSPFENAIRDRGYIEACDFVTERMITGRGDIRPYLERSPITQAVALADKADTLLHLCGVGEQPDGSGDKYKLRREALGIIRRLMTAEDYLIIQTGGLGLSAIKQKSAA